MLLEEFSTIFDRPEKVKKLREYILSLAVRGKLVKQDENDEPASILLSRIREEKGRLVKEKKIKKEKALSEISEDEIPYELPKGWEWARLGEVSNYIKAGGDKPKEFSTIKNSEWSIPVIANGKTNKGIIGYTKVATEDNICITVSGRGTIGYSCIREEPFCPIVRLIVINPSAYVDISYLNYSFKYFIEEGTGTSIQQLTVPMIKPKVIPIPPLDEQKRIVEKVDYLMEFCDKLEFHLERTVKYGALSAKSVLNRVSNCTSYEELEETLSFIIDNFNNLTLTDGAIAEFKNVILSLAVKGKLVPQYETDEPARLLLESIKEEKDRLVKEKKIKKEKPLPEINEDEISYSPPKGWQWVRFNDVTICRDGERIPVSKNDREKREKIYDYYGASGIIDQIDDYIFDKNLLLIGEDGANLITRSKPIAFIAEGKYWVNNHAHVMDSVNEIILRYLSIYINSIDLKPYVTGTAQPKMNQAKLNSIPVIVPPLNEQKRIVEKVDILMKVCDELELRIEESKKYSEKLMNSILQESFEA